MRHKILENQLKNFVINNSHLNNVLENGFFKSSFASKNEISTISNIVAEFEEKEENEKSYGGLTYSLFALSGTNSQKLNDKLKIELQQSTQKLFKSHKTLIHSYIRKDSNFKSEFALHQDWNYTNENLWQTLTGWIALDNIDERNGGLFFLERQLPINTIRSGSYATQRFDIKGLNGKRIKKVSLKKGEAIFFLPSAFHGSFPNMSSKKRRVINFLVFPKAAPFLHYKKLNNFISKEYLATESDIFDNIESLSKGRVSSSNKLNRIIFYNENKVSRKIQKYFQ